MLECKETAREGFLLWSQPPNVGVKHNDPLAAQNSKRRTCDLCKRRTRSVGHSPRVPLAIRDIILTEQ